MSAARTIEFSLTPGAPHRVQNALAALAAVHAAGLDATALAQELGQVGIMSGRGVEQTAGGVTLIDDSFNGNPASMVAALDSLKARPVEERTAHRDPGRHAGTRRRRAGLSRGAGRASRRASMASTASVR